LGKRYQWSAVFKGNEGRVERVYGCYGRGVVNVCVLVSAVLEPLLTGVTVSRGFYKYTSYKQRMMRKKLGGIWYVQIKMEDYIPFTFRCSPTTVSTEHYGWSLPDEKMQM
jgi:hypothetical protein